MVAQQRFTSTTTDNGNPFLDITVDDTVDQNLLLNAGFEAGLSNWTATPSGGVRSGATNVFLGNNAFDPLGNATTTLTQTVDFAARGIAVAGKVALFGGRIRIANETPADEGTIRIDFLDALGAVISSNSQSAKGTSDRWELVGGRVRIPSGTQAARVTFTAVRRTGSANDAAFDAAFLRVVENTYAPDLGAYGQQSTDAFAPQARIYLRSPDLYVDWLRDRQLPIRWETFGNANQSPVRIDLMQDTAMAPRCY